MRPIAARAGPRSCTERTCRCETGARDWAPGYREWAPPSGARRLGDVPVDAGGIARRRAGHPGPAGRVQRPDLAERPGGLRGRPRHRSLVLGAAGRDGPGRSAAAAGRGRARPRPAAVGPARPAGRRRPTSGPASAPGRPVAGASARPAAALRLLAGEARCLVLDNPADPLVTEAVRLLGRPQAQARDVAVRLGVGERQLLRRCRAAVGYGPATLRRVLRFRRFVARLTPGKACRAGRIWPGWPPTPATPIRRT